MGIPNIDERIQTGKGDIISIKVWEVAKSEQAKSEHYPQGKKFSFVFIHQNIRYLGYDNAEQKGIHKHSIDLETGIKQETTINETSIIKILRIFKKEVGQLTNQLYKE
ncbi:MAG: DUF6516 family protein [Candidatus Woesearchaeota archaeon]